MQSIPLLQTSNGASALDPAVVRHADILSIELLAQDKAAIQRRIDSAGAMADDIRRSIQAMSERRFARSSTGEEVTVRLYAWPMMIVSDAKQRVSTEPLLYVSSNPGHAALISKIRQLWRNLFAGSGAAEVMPLPRMVHLNSVLDADPTMAHQCVFNGATVLEGNRPTKFNFTKPGSPETAMFGEAIAAPFLLLAYVATPKKRPDPVPRMDPADKLAVEQLFSALLSSASSSPTVRMLPPLGFFGAIDTLQLESMWHFAEWSEARDLQPKFQATDELHPKEVKCRITAVHDIDDPALAMQHTWSFDSQWRPRDTQLAIMQAVQSRLEKYRRGKIAQLRSHADLGHKNIH